MPLTSIGSGNLGNLFVTLSANSTALVAGMKKAELTVSSSSAKMLSQAGILAGGMTAAFAAIGAAGVYQFGQFDKAMTTSLAIMGDVNQGMRDEMAQTARQIATTSTTSAEKLAESYFFLASAGLNAEQSVAALSTVDSFAIAGQFDMARATDLLTDAQSALGLTVKDTTKNMINMNRISDVLVKANTLANATVEQFSTALTREAGAAMKSFNIDVEEGVAMLAAFADQGVKGEIAGTSISRVLRLMTSAAVTNASAYRELGVAVFDSSGNIRNMADIVGDLENALSSLSDEQRVAALDQLGFKARVQGVILPLLGTSQKIRDYEAALRQAGGTTQEVSEKQLKNFFDQLTITWNRINDILLTIGEQLVPVLATLNTMLQEVTGTSDELNSSFGQFSQNIGPAFLAVVGAIGDAIWGWKLVVKTGELAFLKLAEVISTVFSFIVRVIAGKVQSALSIIDQVAAAAASLVPGMGAVSAAIETANKKVDTFFTANEQGLKDMNSALAEASAQSSAELSALVHQGSFSDRLQKGYEKVTKAIVIENDKISKDVKDTVDAVVSDFDGISPSKATEKINKMFDQAFGEGGVPHRLSGNLGQDPATFEIESLLEQKALAKENLSYLQKVQDQEVALTAETNDKKLALMEAYGEQVRAIQMAQAQLILGSAEQMFGDLAGIAEAFGGRQSAVYKSLFAIGKAFAIADATVKIAQGVAAAAALPFPSNIPAMASVVAATASIVSSIQSVQLTFGGERATGGPVSAGKAYVVGERGPEMFSPGSSGSIIPNEALGGSVKVVVNNYSGANVSVNESTSGNERTIQVMIDRVKSEIGSEIRDGRGNINKALESSFRLRRGAS